VKAGVRGQPDQLVVGDEWRADAACRFPPQGLGPDDWFEYRQKIADRERVRLAMAVCGECPVREECLAYAINTRQPWGIWGGKTADERDIGY
jgi:WhiB family redox-sensing transcriptional regulator